MSQSLLGLINKLIEVESKDAVEFDQVAGVWTGSDEAHAARTAVERRIEAIEDAAIQIGIDGETISALLDGNA